MKRILLVLMACFPVIGLMAAEVEPLAGDTIITLERKRIEVKDNGDRMKVRVYEVDEDGDSVDDELIFEGHYRDGQSYERRKHVKSISLCLLGIKTSIRIGPVLEWASRTSRMGVYM